MMRCWMRAAMLAFVTLAPIACTTQGVVSADSARTYGDPEARASLHQQAEEAYRARRFDEAIERYERLAALQPSNAHAWLRLGNVHHQRGDWLRALAAYRRASARNLAGVETETALRAKALYNIALVDLELAHQALRTLERLDERAVAEAGDAAQLAYEIDRMQLGLEAAAQKLPRVDPIGGESRP